MVEVAIAFVIFGSLGIFWLQDKVMDWWRSR